MYDGDKQINEPRSGEVGSLFYKYEFCKVFTNNEKVNITDYSHKKEAGRAAGLWHLELKNGQHLEIRNHAASKCVLKNVFHYFLLRLV